MGNVIIEQGNILDQHVDAIVNAANTELLHGGGVAGAIVEAGGPVIQEESNAIGPIPLGEAAVTSAGKLKARYIIHAASMRLGEDAEEKNVRSAIENSFIRAHELGLQSIAFPAVGAGIARLPMNVCAQISIELAQRFASSFKTITFVLKSDEAYHAFFQEYQRTFTVKK
ncbi:MAG: macro domain-containing protein [Patescibacteria group bacterium]|nr:macro domain-containing protein [Patescibacteria group bacterium]